MKHRLIVMRLINVNFLIVVGLILLLSTPAQSQFVKTLGGSGWDAGYSVIQTSDGGFAMTGRSESFGAGGSDLLLSKLDAQGNHLWTKTLGGTSFEMGLSVIETSDEGLIVAGRTDSFGEGGSDFVLTKFDASGNHL